MGDTSKGVQTRSRIASFCEHYSFVSSLEPNHVDEVLRDPDWMNAMHEELNNFTKNQVWDLVERPNNYNVIGTKWVFRNKQNEDGIVLRNKARLVAQGFTQGCRSFRENVQRRFRLWWLGSLNCGQSVPRAIMVTSDMQSLCSNSLVYNGGQSGF
jgi:hypothetical protein